jgi:hypothetical protein
MVDGADIRGVIKAIEDHGREIRALRHVIEKVAKEQKPPEVNQIFPGGEIPAKLPTIHLAFMDPNDPRPTCWDHTGIGGKFTITSYAEEVTCKKCLKVMAQNQ